VEEKHSNISDEKIDELLELICNIAILNFEKPITIKGDGNKGDILAMGLNMLAEEWEDSLVSREQLEKSKSQLKRAQEVAKMGYWDLNLVTNELHWSYEIYEMFYVKQSEFGSDYEAFLDLTHPDDREKINKAFLESVENKTKYNVDHRVLLPSGKVIWVNEKCETTYHQNGTPLKSTGTVQDITERKNTENEKLEYGDLLDQSISEIFIFDAKTFKFIKVNKGALKNLQYTLEELKQMTPYDIKPLLSKEEFEELILPLKSGKKDVLRFETFHRRKDGSTYPLLVSLQSTTFQGNPVYFASILDTTEQKKAEQQLQESELRYRNFIKNSQEGIWRMQFNFPIKIETPIKTLSKQLLYDGVIMECNDRMAQTYGYDNSNDFLGKRLIDLFSPNEGLEEEIAIQRAMTFIENDFRIDGAISEEKDRNGQIIFIENSTIGIVKNGHLIEMWGVQRVVTGRIEGQKKLKKSEERYRNLFEKMNEGLMVADAKGIINFVNPQFAQLFGYKEEEVIGRNGFKLFFRPEDLKNIAPRLRSRKKGVHDQYEARMLHKTGRLIWVRVSASPNINEKNEFTGTTALVADISDKKHAELRQEVSYNIAKASNKLVLDITNASKIIHKEIGKVLDARNTYIALYDDQTNVIDFTFVSDSFLSKSSQKVLYKQRSFADGLTEIIIESKKPILLSDKEISEFFVGKNIRKKIKSTPLCFLGAPLKSGGKVIGVIALQSYEDANAFNKKDLEFLLYVSRQIGILLERIKNQEQIIQSEKKYSRLFNEMKEGLLFSDKDGIIKMVNPYFCKLVGYEESELIGENGYNLFHAKSVHKHLKKKVASRIKGISDKYELEFIGKDSNSIWTEISSSPQTDANGDFIGIMSIIKDISERREKEKEMNRLFRQIRSSEEQYRNLVADSPIGIILIEPYSGIIVESNSAFNKLLGYTKEQVNNLSYEHLVCESCWNDTKEVIKNLKENDKTRIEAIYEDVKGNEVYVDTTLSKTMYGDALPVVMINIFDITKRKKIETTNSIAFSIASKASEKDVSTLEFCQFVCHELEQVMDTNDFFISQDIGDNTVSFPFIKDKYFKKNLPLIRKKGNGLSEYIIRTGELVLLNGEDVKYFLDNQGLMQYSQIPKCWIGAPIISKGKVIGAIACQSYTKGNLYNEDHKKLLSVIGTYLGGFFERKLHHEALRESEVRFRGLIENSAEITCIMDIEGYVTYASPSVQTVLGYDPEEIVGSNLFEFVHQDDIEGVMEDHEKRLREGGTGIYKIRKVINKKGEWREIQVISSNQLNNPSIKGFIINAQDVTEIAKVQLELQKEHIKALQYQSMLLSSQLNPHFIFNSLNSIQYYILEQDPAPALNYLSNFAILMRSVLDNSTKPYITLEEEIKFLNIYLDLEENRYRNKFTFSINVSKSIDIYDVLIPPMLLQPYIENTVIHGVGNLAEGGVIKISFKKKGDQVICSIEDNGVGREKANELKTLRTGNTYNSFSTEINNSRLNILNKLGEEKYSGKIEDLQDKKGNPIGTKVTATFPYMVEDE